MLPEYVHNGASLVADRRAQRPLPKEAPVEREQIPILPLDQVRAGVHRGFRCHVLRDLDDHCRPHILRLARIDPRRHADRADGSQVLEQLVDPCRGHFTAHAGKAEARIDWEWLKAQSPVAETTYLRHVKLDAPLRVLMDGREGRGVVLRS